MFLNNKYSDTSQPQQQHNEKCGNTASGVKCPTSILENLLQNSDLLETLMKPISDSNGDLLFDEKLLAKKLEENDTTKIYGNAFLGPNLWNKNELFPSDKFGVKLEYLDVQEFLAENDLNEVDFLGEIQNLEANDNKNINNSNTTTNNNTVLIPPLPSQQQQQSQQVLSLPVKNNELNGSAGSSTSSLDFSLVDIESPDFTFNSSNTSEDGLHDLILKRRLSEEDSDLSDCDSVDYLEDDSSILSDEQLFSKLSKISGDDVKLEAELRKCRKQYLPPELKDEKYWNRRRKNNLAAKRSRDARRMKENQIALRAAFLERENQSLKRQLDECKRETRVLKTRLARYEQKKE